MGVRVLNPYFKVVTEVRGRRPAENLNFLGDELPYSPIMNARGGP